MKNSAHENALQRVIECFPQHWGQIHRLWLKNDDFHELCQNYTDCIEALARHRRADASNRQDWLEEYRTLQRELEIEILGYLKQTDIETRG